MFCYAPTNGKEPLNLLLAFHGFGIKPIDYYTAARLWTIARETRSLLVMPQARGLNWGSLNPNKYRVADFVRIEACIKDVQRKWTLTDKFFLTGFSDGASFAATLAIEWNERVTAIAPYAGLLQRPVVTSHKFPVLLCGNWGDRLVPTTEMQHVAMHFRKEDHRVETVQLAGRHKWNTDANPAIARFFNRES